MFDQNLPESGIYTYAYAVDKALDKCCWNEFVPSNVSRCRSINRHID